MINIYITRNKLESLFVSAFRHVMWWSALAVSHVTAGITSYSEVRAPNSRGTVTRLQQRVWYFCNTSGVKLVRQRTWNIHKWMSFINRYLVNLTDFQMFDFTSCFQHGNWYHNSCLQLIGTLHLLHFQCKATRCWLMSFTYAMTAHDEV